MIFFSAFFKIIKILLYRTIYDFKVEIHKKPNPTAGVEPAIFRLEVERIIHCATRDYWKKFIAQTQDWTGDLTINSRAL